MKSCEPVTTNVTAATKTKHSDLLAVQSNDMLKDPEACKHLAKLAAVQTEPAMAMSVPNAAMMCGVQKAMELTRLQANGTTSHAVSNTGDRTSSPSV